MPFAGYTLKSKRLVYILVAVGALVLALVMRFGFGVTDVSQGLVNAATASAAVTLGATAPVHTGPPPAFRAPRPTLSTPLAPPSVEQPVAPSVTASAPAPAPVPAPEHPVITVPPPAATEPASVEPPAPSSAVVPTITLAPRDAPFDVEVVA